MNGRRTLLGAALLALLLVGGRASAASKYAAMTEEIGVLLNDALGQYKKGNVEAAKLKTQAAYFEVFENLEGPIRVNVSAKANYELEEEFTAIRKMFLRKEPAPAVEARIAGFMARLRSVVPQLEGGVELIASAAGEAERGPTTAAGPGGVEPAWLEAADDIRAGLDGALEARRKGDAEKAASLVNRTFLDHYKNGLLDVAIRSGVSQRKNFDYQSRFSDLEAMIRSGADAPGAAAAVTSLVEDLRKDLPGLPLVAGASAKRAAPRADEKDWAGVAAALAEKVDDAVALFEKGKPEDAVRTVQNAYFDVFEDSGMEAKIGARDAGFKAALEGHFTLIAGMMKGGVPAGSLRAPAAAMKADLAKAAAMLGGAKDSPLALFLYSLTIILREGIEAILIVTMIIAYLVKTGHEDKLKVIYNGCASAVALSVATAILVKWVVRSSAASQETLEGATMLLASGVLFSVSYWLISKVEARKWAAFINGRVGGSLSSRSLRALWFAAFLSVYREGAETVLFYQALASDSAASGVTAVAAGFAAGCVLLIAVYLAMRRGAVRLPVKPFFLSTGALLFYMSFVFSGKGMMELVSGKVLEPTFLPWMPTIPFIGVYPYAETSIPQLLIAAAAAVGVYRAGLWGGETRDAQGRRLQMKKGLLVFMTLAAFGARGAFAYEERIKEYPIGTAKEINRMRVGAVYLLPIDMEPRGMDLPQSQADVHLEADIHAARGNLNGFGAGEWIPFLKVAYTLVNADTGETKAGTFMPMVAKDGPHYGGNVKMMGPGNYTLTFVIDPPSKQGFGRHTDVATGVGKWFQQFSVNYAFKWVPIK